MAPETPEENVRASHARGASPASAGAAGLDERGLLEALGLTKYETNAYLSLLQLGVSDARDLSRASGVPTSKIYETMVRLEALGLVEVQASRPRKFMAREVGEALDELKNAKRREFDNLLKSLPALESRLKIRARTSPKDSTFWSVTTSWHDFANKHLAKAAEAKDEVLIYVDLSGCFGDLLQAMRSGTEPKAFNEADIRILEAIRNIRKHLKNDKVGFRVLVGAGPDDKEAARAWVQTTGTPKFYNRFRIGEPGRQQFLVLDREAVILLLMNPARVGTPLGSTYAQDATLAREIIGAFQEMWDRAEPVSLKAAAATN
ncbi:MAG TPA: helix-turn-helix domain-containing protein [Candidatus Thermoplasmatota archaeon]|nr:helix-turn-helix domain-containing protein [Candidatus Thermoplasmatota archaeon]